MKEKKFFTYFLITFTICILFLAYHMFHFFYLKQSLEHSKNEKMSKKELLQPYSKSTGFKSLINETSIEQCEINGTLPSWLKGTYYATGPACFKLGKTSVKYWFNGLAMIHAFDITDSCHVHYKNAFIKGEFYQRCMKNNAFDAGMTDQKKKSSLLSGMTNLFKTQAPYDNASIALWMFNDTLCASSQTPYPLVINSNTLATEGPLNFDDTLEAHMATATPLYDKNTDTWYTVYTEFGTTTYYYIVSYKNNDAKRTLIAKISTKNPSYLYSVAMTSQYIVLIEPPFIINTFTLLANPSAFMDALEWKPQLGTTFTLINKKTGATKKYSSDAFFMLNVINAFEENDKVIVDLIRYENPSIIQKIQLSHLRSTAPEEIEPSYAYRFTLDNTAVSYNKLSEQHIELPEINKNYCMNNHTYTYGLSSIEPYKFLSDIVKINIKTGKQNTWKQEGCFAGKPTFVQKPGSKHEDEGVLLSIVFNAINNNSFLLILDAQSFKELARIELPHHIPLGVNGCFALDA